jgi:threonine dehydrogenase-like Zn-dependent dehydrogenase
MKRAVTTAIGRIETIETPTPALAPDLVRVRVERVGICGSDVHLFRGTHPYARFPQTQGHEVVGIVEQAGVDAVGAPVPGARVVIEPFVSCGSCYACRIGRSNACHNIQTMGAQVPGALAETIDVRPGQLHETGLDSNLAVFVEPVSIGTHAVHRSGVRSGERVLIFGAGLVGLGAVMAAIDRGAVVAVADTVAPRLVAALALGAVAALAAGRPTFDDELRAFAPDGPAVIIEATGVPAVLAQAVDLVATGGTVVVVGISDRDVTLPVISFTRKEIAVIGSRNSLGAFALSEHLVAQNADVLRGAVRTAEFPLDRAEEAVVYAEERRADVEKVVVKPNEESNI